MRARKKNRPGNGENAMGNSASRASACFFLSSRGHNQPEIAAFFPHPNDEGLGHSFCYVRPTMGLPSITPGPHNDNPALLLRVGSKETTLQQTNEAQTVKIVPQATFKTISGASVSANTSTPPSIPGQEQFVSFSNVPPDHPAAFESSSSFSSIPLQPLPRVACTFSGALSGPVDKVFSSNPYERHPLERGFASGPLERGLFSGPLDMVDRSHFSAPITGSYYKKKSIGFMLKNVSRPVKRVISKTVSKTHSSLSRTSTSRSSWDDLANSEKIFRNPLHVAYGSSEVHWAQGKAGEDRVQIVLSEEHGWLFVGIYDGFNGPDAPNFLLSNLYRAIQDELQGLLCCYDDRTNPIQARTNTGYIRSETVKSKALEEIVNSTECILNAEALHGSKKTRCIFGNREDNSRDEAKRSHPRLQVADMASVCENHTKQGHGSLQEEKENMQFVRNGFGMELTEASQHRPKKKMTGLRSKTEQAGKSIEKMPTSNQQIACRESVKAAVKKSIKRYIHRERKHKQKRWLLWRSDLEQGDIVAVQASDQKRKQRRGGEHQNSKMKTVDHLDVLGALARALEATEFAFLGMTDQVIQDNPELALMGSCVLVMLMRDADVYVMNVGDSRAVLAQKADSDLLDPLSSRGLGNQVSIHLTSLNSKQSNDLGRNGLYHIPGDQIHAHEKVEVRDTLLRVEAGQIVEETTLEIEPVEMSHGERATYLRQQQQVTKYLLGPLQLSSDHNTSVEEELLRIKAEHPDDGTSISNDRVKGSLKVTRAFGAGFLKQPKWNDALLETFRINYIGMAPYITCKPALFHHRLGPQDQFLVLSSDGLYQYMTNEEVVAHVDSFMQRFSDGDPAQHLIEELLFRAAKKAGMDFHELLEIPQGDRRKYHDDVSVLVVSFEGRMWRSCM